MDGAFADAARQAEVKVKMCVIPCALSVMRKLYAHNCPYGTGDGHGDSHDISLGEFFLAPRVWQQRGTRRRRLDLAGTFGGGGVLTAPPTRAELDIRFGLGKTLKRLLLHRDAGDALIGYTACFEGL